jgi:RNA polymerase sigma-70 factor, ECF subfamily
MSTDFRWMLKGRMSHMTDRSWVAGQGRSFPADTQEPIAGSELVRAELIRLLDHYEQSLFAFLIVLSGNEHTASDLVQDTFLRAYENLARGKPVTVQWLYKVARNRAMDEFRRQRREHVRTEPIDNASTEDVDYSDRTAEVHRALLQLSPDDREVLYLAEVDGFRSKEIAQMLGILPGTVRMRLSRAHVRFRKAYGDRS